MLELIRILKDIGRQDGSHLGPILKFVVSTKKSLIFCTEFSIARVIRISLLNV
jgi:hypothetical protein